RVPFQGGPGHAGAPRDLPALDDDVLRSDRVEPGAVHGPDLDLVEAVAERDDLPEVPARVRIGWLGAGAGAHRDDGARLRVTLDDHLVPDDLRALQNEVG